MSSLRNAVVEYLALRRALGYKLERAEPLLAQFLTYLEKLGQTHVTTQSALTWAKLPEASKGGSRSWWSSRLSVVRGFATYLRETVPETEVPPRDLLPGKRRRATPYLYADQEIAALTAAAAMLRTQHRVATYQTLINLLGVTGIRIGEAIWLDRADFDTENNLLVVRNAKFGKSRELPLHKSTADALHSYLGRLDRPQSAARTSALFVSGAGTRLLCSNVQCTFRRLVSRSGLQPRSVRCRPTIHSLRHSFAVRTLLDAYRQSGDASTRIALLSTYLGHVDPAKTYWYLSAAPELLALVGHRLDRYLGGDA